MKDITIIGHGGKYEEGVIKIFKGIQELDSLRNAFAIIATVPTLGEFGNSERGARRLFEKFEPVFRSTSFNLQIPVAVSISVQQGIVIFFPPVRKRR